jgi:asparagine synthase (glutamine-hydrolysing)
MCGIAGFLCFHRPVIDSLDLVGRMLAVSHHRSPDGAGVYLDDRVALGHNRLSIIDLAGGAQPIHNEDKTRHPFSSFP